MKLPIKTFWCHHTLMKMQLVANAVHKKILHWHGPFVHFKEHCRVTVVWLWNSLYWEGPYQCCEPSLFCSAVLCLGDQQFTGRGLDWTAGPQLVPHLPDWWVQNAPPLFLFIILLSNGFGINLTSDTCPSSARLTAKTKWHSLIIKMLGNRKWLS